MSQEALRSAPPSSIADEAPADVSESLAEVSSPPLTFLLEEVRSPGMVRADIDALIVGLGRPPAPDEPLRERADLLLALLDRSNPVGDYTGSGGMKVRHAAKEALLAMGYPYAMELPPELLETKRADGRPAGLTAGNVTLAVVSTLYQSAGMVGVWALLEYFRMPAAAEVSFGIGSILWLFTGVSLVGHHSRSRDMQSIASVVLWAAAVAWILIALPLALFSNGVALAFVPWHLALWTAISLRPEAEEEEALAKSSTQSSP
ncbi:hypothetical protein COCOR_07972 [Corallococcus coralloides DSM 2259]|uniref:Uncharacterized protein n=1 Tax=Corallococcus coralloides (strain ATCC 25202 / DSM 2259 / NBRC 100086 / M2) TaxID=1144275 RepID=H8MY04_CORCM|nr:hypothetical protein [Corallococcus coralloides]AFE07852.1 hypothetical protein COCOR_07972 [Corallococcus coralloides DSM 2259]